MPYEETHADTVVIDGIIVSAVVHHRNRGYIYPFSHPIVVFTEDVETALTNLITEDGSWTYRLVDREFWIQTEDSYTTAQLDAFASQIFDAAMSVVQPVKMKSRQFLGFE